MHAQVGGDSPRRDNWRRRRLCNQMRKKIQTCAIIASEEIGVYRLVERYPGFGAPSHAVHRRISFISVSFIRLR